ncbi:MAG: ABC transporter ATP-binding protein [Desulfobacterales bacterium]|nr:ABC transporter ATP-binding protein [Desulfobacterales bacterium]MDJ0914405.1 ABC transporter ATP-binding protein [Desulfobacterales bacterium]
MSHPILEMKGITKRFPNVVANDRVDLELYPGEVLALLGENGAGKSSLMNVVAGLYRADEGEIFIRGKRVEINSPRDSMNLGVGMVHQNFMLVDTMTVAENIILGLPDIPFRVDMEKVNERIRELSEKYNLQVDPESYIWQLSVGEQQRVEILKLIYRGAEILILDEPTAVLTPQESKELNRVLQQMTSEGKSAVFITHKMEEVMAFSNWVRVLNKGRLVTVKETQKTNPKELAQLMVGRDVLFRLAKKERQTGDVILDLKDVQALDDKGLPALQSISLQIRAGEIMGVAGVAGNGQKQLVEVLTGLRKITGGQIRIFGEEMANKNPLEIINCGVSHIPADRIARGVAGDMSVAGNLAMKCYRKPPLVKRGILHPRRIIDLAKRMIDMFRIDTPTPQTHAKFLSGGNIQKIILAREIDACGGVLIAAYPSRGLDVGATEYIRSQMIEQSECGTAILLISEDLEELMTVADKIMVLYEGRIMDILASSEANTEQIGLLMAGVTEGKTAVGHA